MILLLAPTTTKFEMLASTGVLSFLTSTNRKRSPWFQTIRVLSTSPQDREDATLMPPTQELEGLALEIGGGSTPASSNMGRETLRQSKVMVQSKELRDRHRKVATCFGVHWRPRRGVCIRPLVDREERHHC